MSGIQLNIIFSDFCVLATTREAYFPAGTWYDSRGGLAMSDQLEGKVLTISGVISESPIFIRGGSVIPTIV
jgi:alpha-glucosidase (family GH31 glycosyl hydrolase)